MAKCLVAQSEGPSVTVNAILAGIVKANQLDHLYDKVLGGLNGIEGILSERFVDLTDMSEYENKILCQTPASALGSCRYKLTRTTKQEFDKLVKIMHKHDIEVLIYIGGNDSMDTVAFLNEYVKEKQIDDLRFIGVPKTIDNDLMYIDHCPGYPSSAKYIATTALQTWLDFNVYTRKEVFILETMGKDAGWLAASACLSNIVDLLVLPETVFDETLFLAEIKKCLKEKNKCYVVISEGIKNADGKLIADKKISASNKLRNLIIDTNTASRCKVLELSSIQRCSVIQQSLVDMDESFNLGVCAYMYSNKAKYSGHMVTINRKNSDKYDIEYGIVDASLVIDKIKTFPREWILDNYQGITKEAYDYILPLIDNNTNIIYENGIPAYIKPYYLNNKTN